MSGNQRLRSWEKHFNHVDDFVTVYLDDVLVFNRTWEKHFNRVEKMFGDIEAISTASELEETQIWENSPIISRLRSW